MNVKIYVICVWINEYIKETAQRSFINNILEPTIQLCSTSPMWLFKFNLKLIKINKIENPVCQVY